MAINGSWVLKWVTGIVATLILTALGFMGNGIVENDRTNTKEHIAIRKEIAAATKDNAEKIDQIKDDVADIRVEQREAVTILRRLDK